MKPRRIAWASAVAPIYHNKALVQPAAAAKFITEQWHPVRVRARYDWIYGHDASKALLKTSPGSFWSLHGTFQRIVRNAKVKLVN